VIKSGSDSLRKVQRLAALCTLEARLGGRRVFERFGADPRR
jgi:hypothetical protein